jgi:hypothetical protein
MAIFQLDLFKETVKRDAMCYMPTDDMTIMLQGTEFPIDVKTRIHIHTESEKRKYKNKEMRRYRPICIWSLVAIAAITVLIAATHNSSPGHRVTVENRKLQKPLPFVTESNWLPPVVNYSPSEQHGTHGTTVEFLCSPDDATRRASEQHKMVFLLHVSGDFDDPGFT